VQLDQPRIPEALMAMSMTTSNNADPSNTLTQQVLLIEEQKRMGNSPQEKESLFLVELIFLLLLCRHRWLVILQEIEI